MNHSSLLSIDSSRNRCIAYISRNGIGYWFICSHIYSYSTISKSLRTDKCCSCDTNISTKRGTNNKRIELTHSRISCTISTDYISCIGSIDESSSISGSCSHSISRTINIERISREICICSCSGKGHNISSCIVEPTCWSISCYYRTGSIYSKGYSCRIPSNIGKEKCFYSIASNKCSASICTSIDCCARKICPRKGDSYSCSIYSSTSYCCSCLSSSGKK